MYLKNNPLLTYFVNNGGKIIHKWIHYFDIYHKEMNLFRALEKVSFLEIGVQNGGSAEMWIDYFGKEKVDYVGVDVDENCLRLRDQGLNIIIGDQSDRSFWKALKEKHSDFDIILDDGGHTMEQQIVTFEEMFPTLREGGIYICEDTHTNYLEGYGGGLKREGTFHEYVKNMIDKMHGWYYQSPEETSKNFYCHNIHSITIYDSLIVIEKRRRNSPISLTFGKEGHFIPHRFMNSDHFYKKQSK